MNDEIRLLLMDTCGADGSVALAVTDGGAGRVSAVATLAGRSASEQLLPAIGRMLAEAGWAIGDLRGIGVVNGPGSFTGVRVGVSAAKGLSEAAGLPVVAVSRLEVLARKAGAGVGTVHAALDAGRGEFFYARVVGGAVVAEGLVGRDALSASVRERKSGGGRSVVVVCEASAAEALGDLRPVLVEPLVAGDSLEMVAERIGAGRVADVASLDANYLRRTEQEVLDRLLARRPGQ